VKNSSNPSPFLPVFSFSPSRGAPQPGQWPAYWPLLTRIVGHAQKAHGELVTHVRPVVARAHVFSFTSPTVIATRTVASLFPNRAIKLASSPVHAIVRNWAASAVKRTLHASGGQRPRGVGLPQQGPCFQTWWRFSESIQSGRLFSLGRYFRGLRHAHLFGVRHFHLRGVTKRIECVALKMNRAIRDRLLQL